MATPLTPQLAPAPAGLDGHRSAPAAPCTIRFGAATRDRAARVLEAQLGVVWTAVLESYGHAGAAAPDGDWRLVVEGLTLEPIPAGDRRTQSIQGTQGT